MTEAATTNQTDQKPKSWRPFLLWTTITVCAAAIIALNVMAAPPEEKDVLADPASHQNAQLQMTARNALGMEWLGENLGEPFASALSTPPVAAAQIRTFANDELSRFRSAPPIAELLGPEAAIEILDEIAAAEASRAEPWPIEFAQDLQALRDIYTDGNITLDEADGLRERHGWAGSLATTWNQPESPERKALVEAAVSRAVATVAVISGVGLASLVGLVLFVLAIIFLAFGKIKPRYPKSVADLPARDPVYLEAMALFLLGFLGMQLVELAAGDSPAVGMILMGAQWALTPIPIVWPLLRRRPWSHVKNAIGLHTGTGLFREIGWGVIGYLAGIPIIAVGLVLTLIASSLTDAQPSHPAIDMLAGEDSLLVFAMIYLLACVWAPVSEELIFRGALYHHLRRGMGMLLSAVLVAFIFAAVHPQGFATIPGLMSIAIVLALLREFRGSIIPSMVGHAMHNCALVTLAIITLGG